MKAPSLTILLAVAQCPPAAGGPPLHAERFVREFPHHGIAVRKVVFAELLHLPFGVRQAVYLFRMMTVAFGANAIYAFDASSTGWAAFITAFIFQKPLLYRVGGDRVWEMATEAGATRLSMRAWYASGAHRRRFMFWLTKFSLHRADSIIVTTPILRELYVGEYGISPERLHVVPNPLPERRPDEFVRPRKTIVFASRLVAYKNVDKLIEAVALARREHPELILVLFGDGPEAERLQTLTLHAGYESFVEFRGRTGEDVILAETRACLAVVAPAATEFMPNYLLRGITYGKPFLVSREHGLPFPVPEEYLLDPDEPRAIAEKLTAILSQEGYLNAKVWLAALDYHQTWEDVVKANIKFICDLCVSAFPKA